MREDLGLRLGTAEEGGCGAEVEANPLPIRVIRVVMSAIRPISDLQFGVANTEIGVIQAPEPGPRIMRYELTDFEWTAIRPFLPNKPRGVPRVNDRRVLNGIFLDIAVRRPMVRSAGELWTLHDLLQPVRSLADCWHLGLDHGGLRRNP